MCAKFLYVIGYFLKNMSKVTLFLGAGASKAFDYPTTKEFLDNLQEVLSEEEKEF